MEKFSTGFQQPFHRISTVKKGLKTNRDAVIVFFSTKYRPPIYYYISKRSLTLLNFCLDKGVHFTFSLYGVQNEKACPYGYWQEKS